MKRGLNDSKNSSFVLNRHRAERYSLSLPNNRPRLPMAFYPSPQNRKREQILEDKYTEIERENRILLEKLHKIMCKESPYSQQKPKKSLNLSQRMRQQRQISVENSKILTRLKNQKSFYNFKQANSGSLNFQSRQSSKFIDFAALELPTTLPKLAPLSYDLKHLVFSKSVFIENRLFFVEIFKGQLKIRISLKEVNESLDYNLELPRSEGLILMGGTEDYEKLIKCLHIEGPDVALWQEDINSLNDI